MNWWTPSKPDEIKPVPWLHPAAVLYLESLLTPDMTIIEHGCGGSTLWFAERVKEVHYSERNKEWFDAVISFNKKNVFFDSGVLPTCDLLFIDGFNPDRPRWIITALSIVKPGGIVVIDNAERDHYQQALRELEKYCHPPCTIVAWTDYGKLVQTAFYRLKGGETWI